MYLFLIPVFSLLVYFIMPSKARALAELTRIHWFPVGCDFMFWPFGESRKCHA
jgi:hypothetical protein